MMIAITVLIITCPCALGLAVPVVQVLASGVLMKKGIFVKSGDALERLAAIDTIIFDKTGTLTLGQPTLTSQHNPDDLKHAASLAAHSAHPLSKAIVSIYTGDLHTVKNLKEHTGKGLESVINNKTYRLGSRAWCGNHDIPESEGSEIWLDNGSDKPIVFYFEDTLRVDTAETLHKIHTEGIKTLLLSGDRQIVTDHIAAKAGIHDAAGDLNPVEKYNVMEGLKKEGHHILMVGDGLNDAPTLTGANVSMAPGTAIDMAQNVPDIVFMGQKLEPVAFTHSLSKIVQNLVKQNFALAIIYNLIAIPLAFAGLVTPMVAALAMSGSSLLVIANAFRLKSMP